MSKVADKAFEDEFAEKVPAPAQTPTSEVAEVAKITKVEVEVEKSTESPTTTESPATESQASPPQASPSRAQMARTPSL